MDDLKIINADTLLYTTIEEPNYIVEDILPTGLHLFCGASKVGKSWLMLDLSIKVSKGEPIWDLKTNKSDVLYFALEDTYERLQKRLQKLTDEIGSNLHFANTAKSIQNGFIVDLQNYIKKYPNTRLIVIDTLQKIRRASENMSYSTDYQDISILKKFADDNKIAIILVHHLRKQEDNDVFNMISGTTGIMGSADTTFVLKKKSRDDSVGVLSITGRDVEYQTFTLRFENCRWVLVERSFQKDIELQNAPDIIFKIVDYVRNKGEWQGSATELLKILNDTEIKPQLLTKKLIEYKGTILKDNNIEFQTGRTNEKRLLIFKYHFQESIQEDLFKNSDIENSISDGNNNFAVTNESIDNSEVQENGDSSDSKY